MSGPFKPVRNPVASPPRYGLLVSAPTVTEADDHWVNGIVFVPDWCEDGSDVDNTDCGVSTADPTPEGCAADPVENTPVRLWASRNLGTFNPQSEEIRERTRARLLQVSSTLAEQEFWSGASGAGNAHLNDATATILNSSTATPANQGAALLGREAGQANFGSRCMMHARSDVVTMLVQQLYLRKEGNLYLDPLDNIWVPGVGYDGSGPNAVAADDDTAWVYATPMAYVRITDPDIEEGYYADPRTNIKLQLATRYASITVDPCFKLAILLDICQLCCSTT